MKNDNINRPTFPPMMFIREGDLRKKCEKCGSSLKRKMLFKVMGCESPECLNYYEKGT